MALRTKKKAADNLFFRKLIENSYEGITLIDENFHVIYRSPSAKRINGWKTIDSNVNTLHEVVHPDDKKDLQLILEGLIQQPGQSQTCSFRSKHYDGHYIWLECTYTNMLHDPDIKAIVCNFRDVSNQKRSDTLLQQTVEELSAYKYALDEADIVAITDQKGIITHVNDNFCKISKYSREELIGQDHRLINSSYHGKAFIRDLWKTIAGGKIWKGEIKNKAKDGSHYWVDTTIIPFLNEKGKPYQYVAIRADITERKLYQEKIVESERFTKTITDNVPAMIAYWSAGLRCLFANKAYLEWFDMPQNEMLGIHKNALMDGFEFEQCKPYIKGVLQGIPQSFERTFHKADGKTIYTHTQYVPHKQGDIINGFYSLIYDYSEIKDAETELKQLNERFSLISKATNVALFEWDFEKNKIWWSESYFTMFGFDPQQPYPTREEWLSKIQPESQKLIDRLIADIHSKGLNSWQEEIVYLKPDQTNGTLLSRGVVIRNGNQKAVRIVGSYIDITLQKNEELQKALFAKTSLIFNENAQLAVALKKVLEELVQLVGFNMAEAWLISADKKKIDLVSKFLSNDKMQAFYTETAEIKSFAKGEGLPGTAWESQSTQFWYDIDSDANFVRNTGAKKAGLKSAYGLLLTYNDQIIGVLIFGSCTNENHENTFNSLTGFSAHLGAEVKRKQLEEELTEVFNFTPDILCIANTDGYFKKVNPAMCYLLEYSEEELLSRPFMEFVHPLDKAETATELQNIIEGTPTYYIENRYITKSGKAKWLAWTTTGASELGVLYCSAKDITDKKELEVLFQKTTSLARIGGWEIDLANASAYWSALTRDILEVPPDFEADMEKGISFFKEGESRAIINGAIASAIATGQPWDVELEIITAKGRNKWVRVIGEAEFTDGQCTRIIGSFQEIDARKKAELTAKAALEERNTILESIGDAFFAVDENWIVTYWNSVAETVLNMRKKDVLSRNLWEVFSNSVGSLSYQKYHEALTSNQVVHFEDYYMPLNKWYEVSAYPADTGLSVYFKDITERKLANIRLNELNEHLQKQTKELSVSNAELEQFAYVASHDLQEPLRMVTSFLTQLEKKYSDIVDDRGRQYIHFAVDGAKRMRQIILDLLEFSRIGRLAEKREEIDVNQLVADILTLYHKQIDEQQAELIIDKLPVLQSYRVPLRQVFQNLISNALKYQPSGNKPQVRITCKDAGDLWQFSVMDNGIGIDPEYFEKIFIIFQRLHNKDEYSGTGMGLAITRKIIDNLGGRIWVESHGNDGSTFYFTILKS